MKRVDILARPRELSKSISTFYPPELLDEEIATVNWAGLFSIYDNPHQRKLKSDQFQFNFLSFAVHFSSHFQFVANNLLDF